MSLSIAPAKTEQPRTPNPWILPERTLTVLYGCPEIQRLSHYFLPRILLHQKRVLYLDGANQVSPLLIARFARGRGLEPSVFNNLIRIARAFTCFQLTELIRRVPKVLAAFSPDVLIVTALPDLYFDEDVQDRPARASFEHALEGLQQLAPLQLSIAVFSDATSFKTKRHDFFKKLRNQADRIVRVEDGPESSLSFTHEKKYTASICLTEPARCSMGRTVPTFVQLIQQAAEGWKKFRRALRREDHEHFDRLFVRVRYYTQAATYQCHDNPMEAILLSIALDQEKRLNAVEKVLQNAGVLCDIAARMDSRSLPEPARGDVVADRPEPVALPFD